jgi:acyl-CoA synthetase (AMP-forming)/AMP-acid ligase II
MADATGTKTLLEVLENGAGSHPAIVTPDGPTLTYDELKAQIGRLMNQLSSFGIRRNDRVAITLPNGIEAIASFLAVSGVATAAPLNAAYKPDEFQFYLKDTNARAVITGTDAGEDAVSAAPKGTFHITVSMDKQGEINFSGPVSSGDSSTDTPSADDVALVLHTSGTTSRPKRVPLTHRNLISSLRNVVDTYQLDESDVSLCIMPLFHVHGLIASTLSTFQSGGTVVVPLRFNPLNFWPVVKSHGVTWFSGVPTMHQVLLNRAKSRSADDPARVADTLRFIRSCSAALPPSVMQELEDQFGVPVLEAYGMTEAAHQMASNPLPPGKRLPGSVGPGTGVDVAIMDEAGTLQPVDGNGEVVIRGTNVTQGYENNPEANASSFTNGWFRTGDEGVINADGYLTLTGRLKEIINRSGEKISPREIDEVLLDHPAVAEAVAFGVPHPTHGEEPSATVVLNGEVTPKELVAYCRTRLADFKCPRVIHIVDEIPRSATGKIQRRIVAEAFSKQATSS